MPTLVALPRYQTAVAWSERIDGVFTVGYSTVGGTDTLGQQYPQFPFNEEYDDLSANTLSFEYTRGRTSDLTEVEATSGQVQILDDGEVYNPHNLDSPLRGQLNPLRPFRIRAVGPKLIPLTANGWQIDDVVRARAVLGDDFERALMRKKPLAYWRFDEAAGALAYADAGGDADVLAYPEGTALSDAATLIAGDPGKAKTLASGSRLIVQNGDSVNPRAGMTIVALFTLDAVSGVPVDRYLMHKFEQWSLRIDTEARISFAYTGTDSTEIDVRSTPALANSTPYLAVVSWDGKTVRMWLNGDEVETEAGLGG